MFKIFKKIIFTTMLPLLVSGNTFAAQPKGINIEIYNYAKVKNISKIDEAAETLLFLSNYPSVFNGMDGVNIKINIRDEFKESISNYEKNNCNIEINYKSDLKPLIFTNLSKDLIIATLHEIGHCVLGKKTLFEKINWDDKLKLSEQEKKSLQESIDLKHKKAFETLKEDRECSKDNKCTPKEVFNYYPPMLAYHEMFADLWALAKYSEISCIDAKENAETLNNFRIGKYSKNNNELHQSFLSTFYINDMWGCNTKFDFNELNFYTQKGLIDYLSSQ